MRFEQALEAMRQGKIVRRRGWSLSASLDGTASFIRVAPREAGYALTHSDLLAEDWEVVAEPRTLADVLPAFKEGKRIRRRSWSPQVVFCIDIATPLNVAALSSHDVFADDWEVVD